jgi:hypothetical protein
MTKAGPVAASSPTPTMFERARASANSRYEAFKGTEFFDLSAKVWRAVADLFNYFGRCVKGAYTSSRDWVVFKVTGKAPVKPEPKVEVKEEPPVQQWGLLSYFNPLNYWPFS